MLAWGANESGQLGVGDTQARISPMKVLSSSTATRLSCGSRTSLAVTRSGTILGWGSSTRKVLGEDIEEEAVTIPHTIEGLENMIDVATRGSHAVGLDSRGRLFSWGRGEQADQELTRIVLLPMQVKVKYIGAGRMHSVAIDEDGSVFTWGSSDEGQTGLGHSHFVSSPTLIPNLIGSAVNVSCGSRHTLIVLKTSSSSLLVYAFGGNSYCQLGLGDREPRFSPQVVDVSNQVFTEEYNSVNVACGYRHSFIYTQTNIWSFGWNKNNQCNKSSESVIPFPYSIDIYTIEHEDFRIVKVAGGGRHSLILIQILTSRNFKLLGFGRCSSGELGIPKKVGSSIVVPQVILSLSDLPSANFLPQVACGWEHSVISLVGAKVKAPNFSESIFSGLRGDIDAALAQFINTLLLLHMLPESIQSSLAFTVVLSNLLFGFWALKENATSLPHGINTVSLFAMKQGVFNLVLERHPNQYNRAFAACAFCSIMLGFLQGIASFTVAPFLKRYIPRSALSAAVGGVSLTFITTKFLSEIFEFPSLGLPAFLVLLIGYGARERMPLGLPVTVLSLSIGYVTSLFVEHSASNSTLSFEVDDSKTIEFTMTDILSDSENYPFLLTIVAPLLIVNIVNNIACVEQARASGDLFRPSLAMMLDSFCTRAGTNPIDVAIACFFVLNASAVTTLPTQTIIPSNTIMGNELTNFTKQYGHLMPKNPKKATLINENKNVPPIALNEACPT